MEAMKAVLVRWWRQLIGRDATTTEGMQRRRAVAAVFAGLGGGLLLRHQPADAAGAAAKGLIRPPGALPEADFLDKCIRCSECMKVCPTGVLQPAVFEAGLAGLWTPTLRTRVSFCELKCRMCSEVCPTDAIAKITLPVKQQLQIGLAAVVNDRCLPISYAEPCTACYDVCPVTPKAIWLADATVVANGGHRRTLKQPHVDAKYCIGCGACEHKCPVPGEAAIRVAGVPV
jgi:MauM/NapG family ferredoxin protein